jgi:hypothetical protein
MATRIPKLIIQGVEDYNQVEKIQNLSKNLQIHISNFDISGIREGIITLQFSNLEEAIEFKKQLENETSFMADIKLVRGLFEIPETDENHYRAVDYDPNDFSDGNNSFNRQSPNTPGDGKV